MGNLTSFFAGIDVNQLMSSMVNFLIASVFLGIWWFIVKWISRLTARFVWECKFLKKVFKKIGLPVNLEHVGNFIGILVYVVGLLLILNQFFALLKLTSLTAPLEKVVNDLINFLPAFFTALGLFVLVWAGAHITRNTLKTWFDEIGLDAKAGDYVKGTSLSDTLASAAYWFIFLMFLPTIIWPLGIEWLYDPVNQLVQGIWDFIPNLVVAWVILGVWIILAKIVKEIVSKLLYGVGIDDFATKFGMSKDSNLSLSDLGGVLAATFVVLIASLEASNRLGLSVISDVLNEIINFGINVLVGVVVIAFGFYLSGLVADILKSTSKSKLAPEIVRWAIVFISLAMGLGQIWIGQDIINLTFGLVVGALAVAFALAVGLGGKDVAAKWLSKYIK